MLAVAAVLILIILWFIVNYNSLIKAKNLIREAWSGIDVQLKRRADLIPSLVETVKGYSRYENQLFEDIAAVRGKSMQSGMVQEKAGVENELTAMLKNLFVVAEAYPELKADRNYLDLQKNLVEVEDQIQYARRYYNGTVRDYNIRVESFPGCLVAGMSGFRREEFFEITLATEREAPEVKV